MPATGAVIKTAMLVLVLVACQLLAGLLPAVAQSPDSKTSAHVLNFGQMLNRVLPSVVGIYVVGKEPVEQDNAFYRHPATLLPGAEQNEVLQTRPVSSAGSGVIIAASKTAGLILTNHHVVENATQIGVRLRDGRSLGAKLVGLDAASDVAVISVEAADLPSLAIGRANAAAVGDLVFAIGNPLGLSSTVTLGIVSSLVRSTVGWRNFEAYIQHDASVNPGNSGGALVNVRGELIGINTSIRSPTGGSVGLSFAQPIGLMLKVGSQLVKYGKVRRGEIGIRTADLSPRVVAEQKLAVSEGAVIETVHKGSSGEKAGLKVGDVIVAVGVEIAGLMGEDATFVEVPILSHRTLETIVGVQSIGDKILIGLLRSQQRMAVPVEVAKLSDEVESLAGPDNSVRLRGLVVGELGPSHPKFGEVTGVVVTGVKQGTIAEYSGLLVGDVITRVDGQRSATPQDLFELAGRNGKGPELKVLRGSVPLVVRMPL